MASSLSLSGVTVPEHGRVTEFSIPFIILNMIGGGLSYFVAVVWNNVFQSALDQYKKDEEGQGRKTNAVYLNMIMAVISTIFAISVIYIMIRGYTMIDTATITIPKIK